MLFSSFFEPKDVSEIGKSNGTDIEGIEKSGLSPGLKMFLFGVAYVIIVIKLAAAKSLLDGTKKRQSQLIKPWLIINAITTMIECILIFTVHSTIVLITVFGNRKLKVIF